MRDLKAVLSLRLLCMLSVCAASLTLGGCGASSVSDWAPESAGTAVTGHVQAGQQAVVGAKVYLYAAPTTGYGAASTSLLTNAVLTNNTSATDAASLTGIGGYDGTNYYVATDADGNFSITGDWSCTAGTDIYFLMVGGNPGGYGTNANLKMMAALGNCSSVPSFTFINEVVSAASVYSLAGFMGSPTQVSSASTTASKAGMAAAFATVNNLVNIATGVARTTTPASGNTGNYITGTPSYANLNTLASILAVCENSAGTTTGAGDGTVCGTLFADTTISGGTPPSDTVTATLNLAHYPGVLGTTLYNDLMPTNAAFSPNLSTTPNDWTLPIVFTGTGFNNLYDIAIDGNNNVWALVNGKNGDCAALSNYTGSGLIKMSNLGVSAASSVYTSSDIECPFGIAIDTSNQGWIVNDWAAEVAKVTTSGTITGVYKSGDITYGDGIAFDPSGNIWITNFTAAYITKYNVSGNSWTTYAPGTGSIAAGSGSPKTGEAWGIAVDGSGNVYAASYASTGRITKLNNAGTNQSGTSGYTGAGMSWPFRLALDQSSNIWVGNFGSSASTSPGYTLSEISSTGTAISPSAGYGATSVLGANGGGLYAPFGLAVDGNNNVWAANAGYYGVTEYDNSTDTYNGNFLSNIYGFLGTVLSPTTSAMYFPEALAIDEAGNVWVANYGVNTGSGSGTTAQTIAGSITELVGAAAPTLCPIAAATAAGTPAAKP